MIMDQYADLHGLTRLDWFAPGLSPLTRAIYLTLAYSDIYQFPLHEAEIHRRLIGISATPEALHSHLQNGCLDSRAVSRWDKMYVLSGSEDFIRERNARADSSRKIWPEAFRYARLISSLPFVRMVAVTGALAVNNVDARQDVDYLVVSEPGYLWTCRAWAIALVRLAAVRGVDLCPNYFISENAVLFPDQNLYTAYELIQMVPVAGLDVYHNIRRLNKWADRFLPNAAGPPEMNTRSVRGNNKVQSLIERPFRNGFGSKIERWEMDRKIRKLSRFNGNQGESTFSADWCKGHFNQHGQTALEAFEARLRQLADVIR